MVDEYLETLWTMKGFPVGGGDEFESVLSRRGRTETLRVEVERETQAALTVDPPWSHSTTSNAIPCSHRSVSSPLIIPARQPSSSTMDGTSFKGSI